ncbi:hypothetical protein MARPO_0065s0075, partial [Marchantia polymorpha]
FKILRLNFGVLSTVCPRCLRSEDKLLSAFFLWERGRRAQLSSDEQPIQNSYGQEESNCLIKTKHCVDFHGC